MNNYIKNVLAEMQSILTLKKLKRLELRIMKEEARVESFFIDKINSTNDSRECDKIEDDFRNVLHNLESRCKVIKKMSKDCSFKIFLHADSYNDYLSESRSQVRFLQHVAIYCSSK